VSAVVDRYVRHARRFGDPRTVFETAVRDSLSPTELGRLAARLRREKPTAEAADYWSGEGRNRKRVSWPKFRLTERERHWLARDLLREGVRAKTVATYLGTSTRWVEEFHSDLEAEAECVRVVGIREGEGPAPSTCTTPASTPVCTGT
jgi:hypothetical protein